MTVDMPAVGNSNAYLQGYRYRHKYLIELEYDHYQKIWGTLTRVSPLFDSFEKKLLSGDYFQVTTNELHEARINLADVLNAAYPFINKSIYDVAYFALDRSTKAASCLWENDITINSQNELHKILSYFNTHSSGFQSYTKLTADGIKNQLTRRYIGFGLN